ncbi:hypothetical protein SEEN0624_05666 [Salmonella enterica subsp. enterica serovar Newport str. PRS_2010_0624]|nr:hypothetical protein SEEN0624_05666 [Salmonella enterica subsp. enterica serovar Newport str. PRS_2010_0624]
MKMEFAILQAVIRMFPLSKQNAFKFVTHLYR